MTYSHTLKGLGILTNMAKKKQRITDEEIKQEILNMSQIEIEINTKYIIEFEDYGQDFVEWFIDKRGYILDSQPFQRWIWAGRFTIPENAKVGEKLAIWTGEESYVNYPIKSIKVMEVKQEAMQSEARHSSQA